MKRLPQGWWLDTHHHVKCRVLYYNSKTRSYRVETIWRLGLGGRIRSWVDRDYFDHYAKWVRFKPPTAWDMLDTLDLNDGVARAHEHHRERSPDPSRIRRQLARTGSVLR